MTATQNQPDVVREYRDPGLFRFRTESAEDSHHRTDEPGLAETRDAMVDGGQPDRLEVSVDPGTRRSASRRARTFSGRLHAMLVPAPFCSTLLLLAFLGGLARFSTGRSYPLTSLSL